MAKTPLIARLGAALSAFAAQPEVRTPDAEVVQKGSAWPFNRVPVIDGAAGGASMHRPYAQSAWVMRAIKEVSGPISAVDLKFSDGDTEIEGEAWMEFWQQPVKNLPLPEFIDALVGWLKLAGECFIILPPEFTVPFPDRVAVWPKLLVARPAAMRAEKNSQGELLFWTYTGRNGVTARFLPEQVIQPKFWNPYDDIRGMSEYEAAHVATEADYLSGKFALNIARANGDTGVIVSVKGGGVVDDVQQEQIRNSLRMKALKSQRGEFSSVFIPGDLEVQDPKIKSPDAQFVAQRLENRHEIYIAFGVPPSMADVTQSYSIGSASDRYKLIESTSLPLSKKIAAVISAIASLQAGRPVKAYFDWDDHPVMQAVRRERIDSAVKLCGLGMPPKDASEYLDLDLPRFSGDDIGYIAANLLPVAGASLPEKQPENDPALGEDVVGMALRALQAKGKAPKVKINLSFADIFEEIYGAKYCACGCSLNAADLAVKERDAKEVKLWKSLVAGRRGTINNYIAKFNRVLMTARAEVIGKLERAAALEKSRVTKHVAADFEFNLAAFEKSFEVSMRAVAADALQKSGDEVYAELGKDDPWKMPPAEALKFLNARTKKLEGVPADVARRIRSTIQDGLTNGDPLAKIASAVRSEFNDISKGRATVIAQTETAAAYGKGRHSAMEEAGVQFKRWLTSGNANVRLAHQWMNNTIVALDEPFVVTSADGEVDEIQHPGDDDGEPWNVINCHCVEIASAEGPEEPADPNAE